MSNLFSKYHITKNDGSPVDPNAQYFVLRIDADSAARAAVMVYAMRVEKDDPQFAGELRARVSAQMQAVEHTLAADVCPDCRGKGIVKDGFGQLFECARCHGSGHAAKA